MCSINSRPCGYMEKGGPKLLLKGIVSVKLKLGDESRERKAGQENQKIHTH